MAAAAKKKDGIWETVKTVVYALLIAGVFRTLFFQPFWIPSGSMKDTLLIGDFLFVNPDMPRRSRAAVTALSTPKVEPVFVPGLHSFQVWSLRHIAHRFCPISKMAFVSSTRSFAVNSFATAAS